MTSFNREQMEALLLDYVYGSLNPDDTRLFEESLPQFPDLKKEALELRETRQWVVPHLRENPPELPHKMRADLLRKARIIMAPDPKKESWWASLLHGLTQPAGATALLVLLVSGIGVFQMEKGALISMGDPTPRDDRGSLVEASAPHALPNNEEPGTPLDRVKVEGKNQENPLAEFVEIDPFPNAESGAGSANIPAAKPGSPRGLGNSKGANDRPRAETTQVDKAVYGMKKKENLKNEPTSGKNDVTSMPVAPKTSGGKSKKKAKKKTASYGKIPSSEGIGAPLNYGDPSGVGESPTASMNANSEMPEEKKRRGAPERAVNSQKQAFNKRTSIMESDEQESDSLPLESPTQSGKQAASEETSAMEERVGEKESVDVLDLSVIKSALLAIENGDFERAFSLLSQQIKGRTVASATALDVGVTHFLRAGRIQEAGKLLGVAERTANPRTEWKEALRQARSKMEKYAP